MKTISFFFLIKIRQIDGIAPTFVKKPAIRQEDDGKRLLFECRIKADPKPSVTWSHNAAIVKESKRHKVYISLFSYLVEIKIVIPNIILHATNLVHSYYRRISVNF